MFRQFVARNVDICAPAKNGEAARDRAADAIGGELQVLEFVQRPKLLGGLPEETVIAKPHTCQS